MKQVFYTVDREITIDKNRLWVKKIKLQYNYRFEAAIFPLLLLIILIVAIVNYPEGTDSFAWDMFRGIVFTSVVLNNHWLYIYKWLFAYHWRSNFFLKRIVSVRQLPEENILEVPVEVKTWSGRVTIFHFRKSEAYAAVFVDAVNEQIVFHHPALVNKQ